jgi:putative membrane protein
MDSSAGRTEPAPPAGGRSGGSTMMYWYGDHMSGWGYALVTVSMVLFWALIIVGVVALVRYLGRSGQQTAAPPFERPTPEQVLAERFASGDIDEDEYRRRLDTLRTAGRPATKL